MKFKHIQIYKSFTLIEILITISILVISLYFSTPILLRLSDAFLLDNETKQIQSFFYKLNTQARTLQQNMTVFINQKQDQYCIAVTTKDLCDCFEADLCQKQFIDLYISNKGNFVLNSKDLYPKAFLQINGNRARYQEKCLGIGLNDKKKIIYFRANGIIFDETITQNTKSQCKF